jgi:hypothetical protein
MFPTGIIPKNSCNSIKQMELPKHRLVSSELAESALIDT